MHPSWQRKILSTLKKTFPNVQFIVTTHSPIILSEVNEDYSLFFMEHEGDNIEVKKLPQLNGYDANAVLEQFMETKSINARTEEFIHSIYADIEQKKYALAMEKTKQLADITNENHPDVIMARMELKRRMQ